jgi:hypothetical protein
MEQYIRKTKTSKPFLLVCSSRFKGLENNLIAIFIARHAYLTWLKP